MNLVTILHILPWFQSSFYYCHSTFLYLHSLLIFCFPQGFSFSSLQSIVAFLSWFSLLCFLFLYIVLLFSFSILCSSLFFLYSSFLHCHSALLSLSLPLICLCTSSHIFLNFSLHLSCLVNLLLSVFPYSSCSLCPQSSFIFLPISFNLLSPSHNTEVIFHITCH